MEGSGYRACRSKWPKGGEWRWTAGEGIFPKPAVSVFRASMGAKKAVRGWYLVSVGDAVWILALRRRQSVLASNVCCCYRQPTVWRVCPGLENAARFTCTIFCTAPVFVFERTLRSFTTHHIPLVCDYTMKAPIAVKRKMAETPFFFCGE